MADSAGHGTRGTADSRGSLPGAPPFRKVAWIEINGYDDTSWRIAGVADFTGDGRPDILWRNRESDETRIWRMDHTRKVEVLVPHDVGYPHWRPAGVADFNRDRYPDILWRNVRTGANLVWRMRGAKNVGYIPLNVVPNTRRRVGAVLSPPGEGAVYLLWRNRRTGRNMLWLMDRQRDVAHALLPPMPGAWRVGAAADLDGDGAVDILWRNRRTGRNILWRSHDPVYAAIKRPMHALPQTLRRAWGPPLAVVERGKGRPPWRVYRVGGEGLRNRERHRDAGSERTHAGVFEETE